MKTLAFIREMVTKKRTTNERIPVEPFILSEKRYEPSKFQIVFVHDGIMYEYGFILDAQRIYQEWLYATPMRKRSHENLYFNRQVDGEGKSQIEFGNQLVKRSTNFRQRLNFINEGLKANQLFLPEAAERNVSALNAPVEWITDHLYVLPAHMISKSLDVMPQLYPGFPEFIGRALRTAGTGIASVDTEDVPVDLESDNINLPRLIREKLRDELLRSPSWQHARHETSTGERYVFRRDDENNIFRVTTNMLHMNKMGESIPFDFEDESDGTLRLIYLLPALWLLTQMPVTVVIDELDVRLHTKACEAFIRTALEAADVNSQLIFTTHDTNLLDLDLFRRDEIWFTEKALGGSSEMYSLAEFDIRPDLKIEKGYLNGRFGASPYSGDCTRLGIATDSVFTGKLAA